MKKKQALMNNTKGGGYKNEKLIEYNGNCKVLNEDVNITIKLNTKMKSDLDKDNDMQDVLKRITKLEQRVVDLMSMEVYRIIDRAHITLVRPPVKKTNVILKNVNFQYAMLLWNYIQDHLDDETQEIKEKKDYVDQGELKKFVDENFLLNYLVVNTLDKDYEEDLNERENKDRQKMKDQLTEQLMEQIVNLNPNLSKEQIQEMIGEKYAMIKFKNMATIAGIQKIFKKHIDKYLEKIKEEKTSS